MRRWLLLALLLSPWTAGAAPDLFIEAEVEPQRVYVQAQALYRLRFHQAIDVRDLVIAAPSARLAEMRPVGAERVYETQRDGRRYRVRERSYALFPFASGTLELAGGYASGRIPAPPTEAGDGWRAVRIEAPDAKLAVLPAPTGMESWLPAQSLSLSETGLPETGEVALGRTLRRTLRIEAAGVDAGLLPALDVSAPGMVVHAEAPQITNRFDGERNIAVREQTFQLTLQQVGEITLPELRLAWWNAATASPAVALLPARVLRVAPGMAQPIAPPPKAAMTEAAPPASPADRSSVAASAIAGVLLTLLYFARTALRARWQLYRACRAGDAAAVRDGLLAWASKRGWDALSLGELAERLPDASARQALFALERVLYGPRPEAGRMMPLFDAVRIVKRALRQIEFTSRDAGHRIAAMPATNFPKR